MASFLPSFSVPISPESVLFCLFALVFAALALRHFLRPKLHLPPSPPAVPIFGNWLHVGNDLNHEKLALMSKTYGPVFLLKMGQSNVVVVSSPDLAKEVLHTQSVEFGSRASTVVFDMFTGKGQDMVFTVYSDHWRKMRRIMTAAFFTKKVVQQSGGRWKEEIDSTIADLKGNPATATTGTAMRRRLEMFLYNNVYGMMFNRRFEREDDPLFLELKRLNVLRTTLPQKFDYNYGEFIPILRPFLRGYLQLCQKVNEERLALFKKHFLDEHKKLTSVRPPSSEEKCGIDHVLDAQKNGEITDENVLYIIENVNAAALGTTLWSMEWGLAELVNNPDIQKRLREEMSTELGYGVPLTEPDLPRLPYLQAVVKEAIRMHTPVPFVVPHMNLRQAKLGGYDIPAESKILVNTWYLANNPEWWEKPEVFNPDRFLLGQEKIDASGNDFRFLPFGAGRRSCPGIILAMPIVSLALGRLVQAFHLLPPPGQTKVDMAGQAGQFNWYIAHDLVVVCKPV